MIDLRSLSSARAWVIVAPDGMVRAVQFEMHAAWNQFFSYSPPGGFNPGVARAPIGEAIQAYQAIGYRCVECEMRPIAAADRPGPAGDDDDPADWEPWACDAQRAAEAKAIADHRAGLTEPMDSLMGEGGAGAVTGTVTSLEPTELGWEAVILCRMARDAGFALDSRVGDRVSVASLPPGPDQGSTIDA